MVIQAISTVFDKKKQKTIYEYPALTYALAGNIQNNLIAVANTLNSILPGGVEAEYVIPSNTGQNVAKIYLIPTYIAQVDDDSSIAWPLKIGTYSFGGIVQNDNILINGAPISILLNKKNYAFTVNNLQSLTIKKILANHTVSMNDFQTTPIASFTLTNNIGLQMQIRVLIEIEWLQ